MSKNLPKIEWLHTFSDIVELKSYKQAGDRAGISDSAAFKRIENLKESLFDLELLHANDIRPTESGKRILEIASRMIDLEKELCTVAERLKKGDEGNIRIACYPAHIQHFLAEVIGSFKRRYPKAKVDFAPIDHSGTAGQGTLDQLRERKVDVAAGPRRIEFGGYKMYESKLVVVVSENHPLRRATTISITQLKDEDLLLAPSKYFSRGEVDRACLDAGFSPQVLIESTSWAALHALGRNGVGIAIVPDDTLEAGATAYPVLVSMKKTPITKETWFQWRKDQHHSLAVENFIEYVQKFSEARMKR